LFLKGGKIHLVRNKLFLFVTDDIQETIISVKVAKAHGKLPWKDSLCCF